MSEDLFSWKPENKRTRADQILAAFVKFHRANPKVWSLFKRFSLDVIKRGLRNYSSDCVCHRIRWHTAIETTGEDVKINDNYTAYYARMFHLAYPNHDGFFRNRRLISEKKAAYSNDIQVFHSGPPNTEETITARLIDLLNEEL